MSSLSFFRCNQTECLTAQRTKFDRNNEFELFVQKAMDKISDSELNGLNLQPSFWKKKEYYTLPGAIFCHCFEYFPFFENIFL